MTTDRQGTPRRVLVTGVGGAPGFDLARSLMRRGFQVVGADANPLAAGLRLPGLTPRTMPPAGDKAYATDLLGLCRDLRPDALLSTVEDELPHLVQLRRHLVKLGVRTWLPDAHAVEACVDKARFAAVLAEHGIPAPRTFSPRQLDQVPDGCALVVKPRRGQGAQGVHYCSTREQARVLCELVPLPIVQERIGGREFTADCLVDRSGRASVILRHRLLVKGGLSMVAATFDDEDVTRLVKATLSAVGAIGLCCVQGFIRDGDGSRVVITEVNARAAGAFALSEAAGADLVGQTLNGLFGLPVDHDRLTYTPGTCLTKYVETLTTERTRP